MPDILDELLAGSGQPQQPQASSQQTADSQWLSTPPSAKITVHPQQQGNVLDQISATQSSPMAQAQQQGSWTDYLPSGISDIPHEMARTAGEHWENIKGLNPIGMGESGVFEGLGKTGKGLMSAAAIVPDVAIGAPARSVIGHTMAGVEGLLGTNVNPNNIYQQETPEETYNRWRNNVDLALAAVRPAGRGPRGPLPKSTGPRGNVPFIDDLFEAADTQFAQARNSGLAIKPQAMQNLASTIKSDLRGEGFRPLNQPKAFGMIDELGEAVNQSGFTGVADIHSVRKALGKVAKSTDATERDAARRAIGMIDDYMTKIPGTDIAAGHANAPTAIQAFMDAKANYNAAMRSEAIEDILKLAKDRAATGGSGANIDNVVRQEVRKLLNSPSRSRGFTPAELEEMRKIVRGDFAGNALRYIGKLSPTGIVSGALGIELGQALLGSVKGMGLPLAGYAAKKMADARTLGKVSNLAEDVRAARTALPTAGTSPVTGLPRPSVLAPGFLTPLLSRNSSQ